MISGSVTTPTRRPTGCAPTVCTTRHMTSYATTRRRSAISGASASALLLDLGVGFEPNQFASAKMWAEFFPGARVVAVDIQDGLQPPNDHILFEQVGTSSRSENLLRLARGARPTVVVEDASHVWAHQMLSFFYLFPSLEPGGVYVWEDLHTGGPTMQSTFSQGYPFSPADLMTVLVQKMLLRDGPEADCRAHRFGL